MIDPTQIDRADVYKGNALAGTLTRERDDVVFRYDPDYLVSNPRPIATTLPVSATEVRERGGAVPPFFAGLLPEGRRLTALRSTIKTSDDDELSQLLVVGNDCVGDVRILPAGTDPSTVPEQEPSVSLPHEVSFRELFESELATGLGSAPSIPGVQEKLSDQMLSLPVRRRTGSAILKLSPHAYPRLVENEAFFLGLAKTVGLQVPAFSVIEDRDGERGLLVERFDRHRDRGAPGRRAQEDAVQLAGRWPSAKYRLSTSEVFAAVLRVTPARPVAALRLLRLFAYSYLIGNGDLHGKNVSVYDHPEGVWTVTPAYDLITTIPYGDQRMALQLEGRDARLRRATFVSFGASVGLRERVVAHVLDDLADGIEPHIDDVADIGFEPKPTEHLIRAMRERLKEIRES